MRISSAVCALVACLPCLLAVDIFGSISSTDSTGLPVLPLSPDSSVLLDGGSGGKAFIGRDGSFRLRDVPAGDYVLSVLNRDYSFPNLLVTVSDTAAEARPYTIGRMQAEHSLVPTLPYPIQLKATERIQYYDVPQAFSFMRLLQQNKMIVFMVGGMAFAVGMPKLIGMLDPEILKEVQANQAEMHRNLNTAQNVDIAGSLSKMLSGNTDQKASSPAVSGAVRKRR